MFHQSNSKIFKYTVTIFVLTFNASCASDQKKYEVISHRGVHHTYGEIYQKGAKGFIENKKGCLNYKNYRHNYIENTIESIQKAFDLGASIVEIDLARTKDDKFILIHELNLECQTGVAGLVRDKTWDEIKDLDAGFGITFDSGKTFPLRGKGIGKITTLEVVLKSFPGKIFLINPKDWGYETGVLLAKKLKKSGVKNVDKFLYWGKDMPLYNGFSDELRQKIEFLPSPKQASACLEFFEPEYKKSHLPKECFTHTGIVLNYKDIKNVEKTKVFISEAKKRNLKLYLFLADYYKKIPNIFEGFEGLIISNIDEFDLTEIKTQ